MKNITEQDLVRFKAAVSLINNHAPVETANTTLERFIGLEALLKSLEASEMHRPLGCSRTKGTYHYMWRVLWEAYYRHPGHTPAGNGNVAATQECDILFAAYTHVLKLTGIQDD